MANSRDADMVLWRLERRDTLTGIAKKLFGLSDPGQISEKVRDLQRLNPHIANPDLIYEGQIVAVGRADGVVANALHAHELLEIERILGPRDEDLFNAWPLFHGAAQYVGPSMYPLYSMIGPHSIRTQLGRAPSHNSSDHLKFVVSNTSQVAQGVLGALKQAAMGNYIRSPGVENVFRSVEGEVIRNVEKQLRYIRQSNQVLKIIPNGQRAFNYGGRAIVVNPRQVGSIRKYAEVVKEAKDLFRLAKNTGNVLVLVDLGLYGYEVHEALGTKDQNLKIAKATGRTALGIGAGLVGEKIGSGVCGLLTISTGAGGALCYFTVIVGSAYLASAGGAFFGEFLYKVYESAIPKEMNIR